MAQLWQVPIFRVSSSSRILLSNGIIFLPQLVLAWQAAGSPLFFPHVISIVQRGLQVLLSQSGTEPPSSAWLQGGRFLYLLVSIAATLFSWSSLRIPPSISQKISPSS
jgi:hypothetical protein